MATITIPENAVPIKKGMVTKEVYFEGKAKNEVNVDNSTQQITNIENELYIKGYFVRPSGVFTGCEVKNIGTITSEFEYGSLYDTRTGSYGKVKVIFNKQVTINYTPENNNVIFCIPEVPEIPNVEKLPTSSTLTDTVNKNIEVKNKIDACKNKLAYILTNKKLPSTKEEKMTELIDKVNDLGDAPPPIYGVRVMENNSNPNSCCTYIENAVGVNPANSTSLGGWANKFPFDKIRIVGFKNGQVTKEIKKNNKAQYTDGTNVPSDVDVMVEIPKVYWKFTNISNGYELRISNTKIEGSDCYAHKVGGVEKDFIYVGAYLGYVEGNKLRSKSGVSPTVNTTLTQFRNYAHNVGSGYQQWNWFTLLLLQNLYLLAYKNLNSQSALGQGVCSVSNKVNTGGTNTKGMMFGSSNGGQQVCFLGIEDFYGNIYQWVDGMYFDGSRILVVSDNRNFNDNRSGFVSVGNANTVSSGRISKVIGTSQGGFFPKQCSGSDTTYYCDYGAVNSEYFGISGGLWSFGADVGAFYLRVNYRASVSYSYLGSRLVFLG